MFAFLTQYCLLLEIGLLKTKISNRNLRVIIYYFSFHLLGLNALMGAIDNLLEFKPNIGPCTERLYAVLPAGVDTSTPSEISSLIIFFSLINF